MLLTTDILGEKVLRSRCNIEQSSETLIQAALCALVGEWLYEEGT